MSYGNPKVEEVMAPLYGGKIATADYNRIYSLVLDGFRWRAEVASLRRRIAELEQQISHGRLGAERQSPTNAAATGCDDEGTR